MNTTGIMSAKAFRDGIAEEKQKRQEEVSALQLTEIGEAIEREYQVALQRAYNACLEDDLSIRVFLRKQEMNELTKKALESAGWKVKSGDHGTVNGEKEFGYTLTAL